MRLPFRALQRSIFARAIFQELAIFSASHDELWIELFKHGRLPAPNS